MFFKVMLLVLPVLGHGIKIQIQPSTKNAAVEVETSDSSVTIISDSDRSIFQIKDGQLKQAVSKFIGGYPTEVYVRSPTPWNDLYTTYNWNQIRRTITATSARIIGNRSALVLISQYELSNNSSTKAFSNVNVANEVENTVSHTWNKGGELGGGFSMDVAINSTSMSMFYSNTWGNNLTGTQTVMVEKLSGVQVELIPGQTVTANLTVHACTMEIEVDYVAKLYGQVASNFYPRFKGHHFWACDINAVLESANLPKEIKAKEIIKVNFFEDARIIVVDNKSNMVLLNESVHIN